MQPRIETLQETKLAGKRITTSFADIKTKELWQSFMPIKKEITNPVGRNLYSIEVYNSVSFFNNFNPTATCDKWAAIEVTDFENIPTALETLVLPEGLYAVFIYKGLAINAPKTYEYIFRTWLPSSNFQLDNRPHFALMGEKYLRDNPLSEEEIWIPIKPKE